MINIPTFFLFAQVVEIDQTTIDNIVPFKRFTVEDRFNRKITAYLSKPQVETCEKNLPLILLINGSGCQSVWTKFHDRIRSGLQGLIYQLVKGRARVLIVEKPGVRFLDTPKKMGSAEEGSKEFLKEHTLPRWTEANMAALKTVLSQPDINSKKIMVTGHSEGGIVAARVAAKIPEITHVAPLGCGGVTQLFSLIEFARAGAPDGHKEPAVQDVVDNWAIIQKKPNSTEYFWMGHPYRRWSTFLSDSVVDELKRTNAKVYLAQGTEDQSDSVIGFDVMYAELLVQGRDVTAERIEGGDHSFSVKCDGRGMVSVFKNVIEWFLC